MSVSTLGDKCGGKTEEKPWTDAEQKMLENAMRTVDKSLEDRWDRIAEMVPTRSRRDVLARVKDLKKMLSGAATGAAPVSAAPAPAVPEGGKAPQVLSSAGQASAARLARHRALMGVSGGSPSELPAPLPVPVLDTALHTGGGEAAGKNKEESGGSGGSGGGSAGVKKAPIIVITREDLEKKAPVVAQAASKGKVTPAHCSKPFVLNPTVTEFAPGTGFAGADASAASNGKGGRGEGSGRRDKADAAAPAASGKGGRGEGRARRADDAGAMVSEGGAVASEGQRNTSRGARVKVCNIVLRCSCSFTCYTSTKVRILTEGGRRVMLLCRQMASLLQETRKKERMGSVEVCATRQTILRGSHQQCVCMCGLCVCVCVCVCCERERASESKYSISRV